MPISEDKVRATIIMDKELKAKLQNLAKEDKRSLSSYIALLLENHVNTLQSK